MTSYIWGNLERATGDNTLIDEAISEAVNAHNDDPDAHLEAGQALESHRAAEIIDHRAESIVNDKLKPKTRAWTAIVDPQSEYDYSTVQGAVDYVNSIGGGSVFVKRGRHQISGTMHIDGKTEIHGEGMGESILYAAGPGTSIIDFAGGNYNSDYYPLYVTFMDGAGNWEDWDSGLTGWMQIEDGTVIDSFVTGTRFFFDGDTVERRVTWDSGTGIVQFSPQYMPVDINGDVTTWYFLRFTNNSKTVEVIGDYINGTGWNNPAYGLFNREGVVLGDIESYDSVNARFTMKEPWTGTTQTTQGFVGVGFGERNNISGITFEGQLAAMECSVNLGNSIRPLSVVFKECEFRGDKLNIGMLFDVNYRGIFDSCTFRITKNTNFSVIHNCTIRESKILFERASAQSLELQGKCEVLDCLITNQGFTTAGFLSMVASEALISNCQIFMNGARNWAPLGSGRFVMSDSYIELLGAGSLTIRGRQTVIADCVVRCMGTGRLVVNGAQCRLAAVGNITSHAFTTTGIFAKIENNLVGTL